MPAYRFGNTSIDFACADASWLSYVERRFRPFRVEESGDTNGGSNPFHVAFECTTSHPPDELSSPWSTHLETCRIHETETGFAVATETTSARVNLEGRRAELRGPCALYPLDNLLRTLLPALGEQGVLVHGAALARDGRGVLACGPSGAGKSTLASLARPNALCDELSAIQPARDATKLTSLPFWEARPAEVDLHAVLLLRHGRDHALEPLSHADAFRRLSQQVLWPVDLPRAMDRALGDVTAVLSEVPVFELSFSPRPDVWNFIEDRVLR